MSQEKKVNAIHTDTTWKRAHVEGWDKRENGKSWESVGVLLMSIHSWQHKKQRHLKA